MSLKKIKRIEIVKRIFSNLSGIKVEISNKKILRGKKKHLLTRQNIFG